MPRAYTTNTSPCSTAGGTGRGRSSGRFPRTYSPLGDYGGWGLPGNLAYNVWGPHGLQLVFRSGNQLLLGTQRPAELLAVLAALHAADASRPISL